MTTKHRITAGFICMIAILAAIAFLGYRYLDEAIVGLGEYDRLAQQNVRIGKAMTSLSAASSAVNAYLNSLDSDELKAATAALAEMDKHITDAEQVMTQQDSLAVVAQVRELGRSYSKHLETLKEMTELLQDQYQGYFVPNSQAMNEAFQVISKNEAASSNSDLLLLVDQALAEYSIMSTHLGRFSYGRQEMDRMLIEQHMAVVKPLLQKMQSVMVSRVGRLVYTTELVPASGIVFTAVDSVLLAAGDADKALADMSANKSAIEKELALMSASYDQRMTEDGATIMAGSKNGQIIMFAGSALGLLLGLALAVLIISGLVRVLSEASKLAKAVAGGDFSYAVKVKEGGEIGTMIAALQQIPAVLKRLVAETHGLAGDIMGGRLRGRLDSEAFAGDFADLTHTINVVGDAYTSLIDSVGLPIMCCDRERRILFLNSFAQKALGGDVSGKLCSAELQADHCNGDKCLGRCAMTGKSMVREETTIRPQGQSVQVNVTAMPLYNQEQEVVGFMEVLSDVSEIRSQQAIMLRVAGEASEISNRIAAASEELATQVERITQGAEVQRDRVSSTASAIAEMNAAVLEVAKSADEASTQSENTRLEAQQGAKLVHEVMTAISAVDAVGQNLHVNMQDLGKQAESIGNIMNVISDIADQTNLLALNAAIEAARAGDAGRGFAVVANEVRKLAEKTMSATSEVGSSISAIQKSTQVNIAEVGKAVASVAEANKLAVSSGEALKKIVDMASANSTVVSTIAAASNQQSATSEEIGCATEEINKIVAETASNMVQSSAAVQELAVTAQALRRVMEDLRAA